MANKCDHDSLVLSFAATESQASAGIAEVSARLSALGLTSEKASDVKIALAEAINNVVEHAYTGLAAKEVQIRCQFRENRLVVQIVDSGKPMPDLQPPDGVPPPVETALQDLPEGGFGWFLIQQLASSVAYERRDGLNLLALCFELGEGPATGIETSQ